MVFFSLYVIWTKVGAPVIDGVQGRYFLPLVAFLALLFPQVRQKGQIVPSLGIHQITVIIVGIYFAIDAVTITNVLTARYW